MADKSYTILCKGLWCRQDSNWDQGTPYDEYYAIVNVMAANSAGVWEENTVRVPSGASAFTGVDSGDFRKVEVLLWDGPLNRVSIGSQLMEEDQGDSDRIRKIVEGAAKAAIEQGGSMGGFEVPDNFEDDVAQAFASIFDLEDDKVDNFQSRHFSSKRVASLVASPKRYTNPEKCGYRFRTSHNGGGASLVLYYDIFES